MAVRQSWNGCGSRQFLKLQGISMSTDGRWLVQGTPQFVNSTGPDENTNNFTGQATVYYREDLDSSNWKKKYVLVPKQNHIGMRCYDRCHDITKNTGLLDGRWFTICCGSLFINAHESAIHLRHVLQATGLAIRSQSVGTGRALSLGRGSAIPRASDRALPMSSTVTATRCGGSATARRSSLFQVMASRSTTLGMLRFTGQHQCVWLP